MKNLAILFFLVIFALNTYGQTPKTTPKRTPKTVKTVAAKLGTESEEFEKAKAVSDASERIAALQNFIKNFPQSTEITRAQGLIVTARTEFGIIKLKAGDLQGGIEAYKTAVGEAPTPVPDELFSKVLLGLPVSLYALNQRAAAFDVAKLIEEKVGANAAQMLDLSKFYLNVEYGTEAIRLAQKSVELAPASAEGYQVLATAYRLNFRLEDAANTYAKAIELDSESVAARLSLAEMKRALGKTEEAASIYREILAKDSENKQAQTGLTLALFDADRVKEAEAELKKALDADPQNARLLTSAAYWYAARGFNEQAIEHARKAVSIEPRNVWSYIAQARALTAQNKPLEAEKVLLAARQYSDFPTLDYELASVRLAAGLYREAAETLKRSFAVNKEGLIETYLGNRVLADAKSFTELLSLERRTAIFETSVADSEENTNKLKALLAFHQKMEAKDATEDELVQAADEFARGGDNMRLHRQLFAANRLLQKKAAPSKVLELMQAAIDGVDAALNVASPVTAVMAEEIYDTRQFYISQSLVLVEPSVPRQTLSAILRGRIEDTAGQAFFQQNNAAQSIVRLKRALSVLPDKSAWQRASQWHLGEVLQADGKEKEALDAYIKGYNRDVPDTQKRAFIETLYQKVNGNLDGLDDKIGVKPETAPTVATTETKPTPTNTDNVKTTEPTPSPEVKPEPTPEAKTAETPQITETKTEPSPTPETKTENPTLPEKSPVATPSPTEIKTEETKPEIKPEPSPAQTETPTIVAQPTPTPETKTEENKPPEIKPEPSPVPSPTPQNVSVIITDKLAPNSPLPKSDETKTQNKTLEAANVQKPLFEPVVINVGKTEASKPENTEPKPSEEKPSEIKPIEIVQKTENKPAEEKPVEAVNKPEVLITDALKTENKPAEKQPEDRPTGKSAEKPSDEKLLSGENRVRIIITENTGAKTVTEEISTCKLIVNPDSLSLLNGGGSLGVMVGFEGEGDFRQIDATSSSAEDVEVRRDPEIGASQNRAFFVVKSVSAKQGIFTVTFQAPCGKKEILVKVR